MFVFISFWEMCCSVDVLTLLYVNHVPNCVLHSVATELINKLNFLEDEDPDAPPAMNINPFDDPDDDLHPNHMNPFGDPDEDGMFNSVLILLWLLDCNFGWF